MNSTAATLADFVRAQESLVVLTGAGVSTASGIPDYRDRDGEWKHSEPIQYGDFVRNADARRRYWSRSFVGWRRFSRAAPNAAHHALARLEAAGKIEMLITQNVDRLHSRAGSRRVIDLHGDLGYVRCMDCDQRLSRGTFQASLEEANPEWHAVVFRYKPDGDAELAAESYRDFNVPPCNACGGTMKPDVVMFGESVPRNRVGDAVAALDRAAALLVVGSSLMVFSGFRFARQASEQGKPIGIVNRGRTRADELATLKVDADCGDTLASLVAGAAAGPGRPDRPEPGVRQNV